MLANTKAPVTITEAEICAMIDSLSEDVATALNSTDLGLLADLYTATDLRIVYDPEDHGGHQHTAAEPGG